MRIGYEDLDSLLTYPDADNLSASSSPIRISASLLPPVARQRYTVFSALNILAVSWSSCGACGLQARESSSGPARRAAHQPQTGRSRSRVIAPNESPAHASCGGGRQQNECLGRKHQQATQSLHTTRRKQCKRRALTSFRASRGTRWSRAAGSQRAGTGDSRPRARGAR